jgi:hypothetical protein
VAVVKDLIEVTCSPALVPPLLVLLAERVRAVVAVDSGPSLQREELQPKLAIGVKRVVGPLLLGEGVAALDDKQL